MTGRVTVTVPPAGGCAMPGCAGEHPAGEVMCRACWQAVPAAIRRRLAIAHNVYAAAVADAVRAVLDAT